MNLVHAKIVYSNLGGEDGRFCNVGGGGVEGQRRCKSRGKGKRGRIVQRGGGGRAQEVVSARGGEGLASGGG